MKPNYNNFLKTWSTENKITSFFGSDKPDFLKAWSDIKNEAVKKKEVVMKQKEIIFEEDPDIISGELQKLIYITSLDKIKKALVDINFKGRMNTNKVLLNMQLLQNLDINKQKELINKLK